MMRAEILQDEAVLPPRTEATPRMRQLTLPWQHVALGMILALAAFLNFFQLSRNGYANSFYAAAVKSMSENWHNFFFNSFDPSGFVTIDKPPLGFWFQVASVKLFGFGGVSILLPEALAGVLSVALLYRLVARVFGRGAGLLAALLLALTPVAVADNRNNTIDSTLVLFMLLGAWAISQAVEAARPGARAHPLRWLLVCAALIGLAFNIKMLEAYLVVPAFGLVYLLGAPVRLRIRVMHLLLAALVLLSVSLSWAVAVDLTPASQRPWVDSTTTNSELDLAIGYNGLQRLLGQAGVGGGAPGHPSGTGDGNRRMTKAGTGASLGASASAPITGTAALAGAGATPRLSISGTPLSAMSSGSVAQGVSGGPGGGGPGGGLFDNGAAGPLRLLNYQLGSQVGWLLPLAAIGLLVAGSRRVRFPLDSQQKGVILWGVWLITTVGFFSVAGFFHSYYLVTVAPAVAALAGIGIMLLWQECLRRPARRHRRGWLLPVALLLTALAQVQILAGFPDWSRWLAPILLVPTVGAALVLVAARLPRVRVPRLWTPVAMAVGTMALLLAPTVWSIDTTMSAGSSIPSAGPSARSTNSFGGGRPGGPGNGGFGGIAPTGQVAVGGSGQPAAGAGSGQSAMGAPGGQLPAGAQPGQTGPAGGGFGGGAPAGGMDGAGVDAQLLSYLEQHQGSTTYLLVTGNSNSAAPYIIATGKPVMSLGGFTGSDPILTLAQFKALVKNNTVRYVLGGGGPGGGGQDGEDAIMQWVQTSCKAVSLTGVQRTSASATQHSTAARGGRQGFGGGSSLYDCAGA